MKQSRRHLSYANVMSTLAVALVVGGGAAMAAQSILPKNSVGSKQLRRGAVRTADIRNQAVTLPKIARSARQALQGPVGPTGPAGTPGELGPLVIRYVEFQVAATSLSSQEIASCAAGERVVSGGVGFTTSPGSGDRVVYTAPGIGEGLAAAGDTPTTWEGSIYNSEGEAKTARVYAVCAGSP